jgi:hypothetical protein
MAGTDANVATVVGIFNYDELQSLSGNLEWQTHKHFYSATVAKKKMDERKQYRKKIRMGYNSDLLLYF